MEARLVSSAVAPCKCSSEHRPMPPWNHWHHVHPLEDGGPDVPENEMAVCPALHDQIHVVIRASKRAGKLAPRPLGFNLWGYRLASVGFAMIQEANGEA